MQHSRMLRCRQPVRRRYYSMLPCSRPRQHDEHGVAILNLQTGQLKTYYTKESSISPKESVGPGAGCGQQACIPRVA